ncbi:hypothetical protein PR202_gb24183 [Eleusine coracana subsp. coracana]|uniref:BURP domain-containing protein n=1 Tax=Eleusine coracana subsp. coracana TaxID=191504 RepID=A0AAV5FKZ3_ELECO|nr:hypothetical protein PR202_gb24183 [Eleusine coracana subsp. coracana]
MVHGHSAVNTPTALFWEQTLPGSRMPDAIADLVRKGIDHSPLVEHHTAAISPRSSLSACALFDSTCSSQMVAETGIFFPMAQLRPGSTMTLSFPAEAEPAAILPHDVAEKAPFSNLDDVLSTFNIPSGSDEAARVRDTLTSCEAPPLAGVVKSCSTSLESTVQAATQMLGISTTNNHGVMAAAAPEIPRTGLPRQPYVVQAVTQLASDRYVSCHVMPFPYAVYLCHTTEKEPYGGFKVWLRGVGDEGPEVSLLAFCHMDTSRWNPAHPAFEVLHTRPGGSPVCHFTTYGSLAFVRKASTRA